MALRITHIKLVENCINPSRLGKGKDDGTSNGYMVEYREVSRNTERVEYEITRDGDTVAIKSTATGESVLVPWAQVRFALSAPWPAAAPAQAPARVGGKRP
jgi:hypothetical protein